MDNKEFLENVELPEDLKKDFTTNFTLEELTKLIQKYWYETPKDNIVVYTTGIEGKLNFQQQIVELVGGTYTEEQREIDRQALINSGQTIFKI